VPARATHVPHARVPGGQRRSLTDISEPMPSADVRAGQPFQQAKADHDFTEQELELKTNTQLTREIDRLTIKLHNRLVGKPARHQQALLTA
jgi:hypothetical protein